MATETIAVLSDSELKDGEMYVHFRNWPSVRSRVYRATFFTGRKSPSERKERSCSRELAIASMRRAHSVLSKLLGTEAILRMPPNRLPLNSYGAPLAKGVLTGDGRVVW